MTGWIRRPRWTPAYVVPAADDYAEIEIAADDVTA